MFKTIAAPLLAASLALGLSLGSTCVAQNGTELNFGIIATESTANLKQDWQPILDDMARKTGFKVNAFFASDYASVVEAMRFNKVQVAWHGNKSATEAVDRAGGEVFAQMVNADGSQGYTSHLIVHRDSPIKSLDDVIANGKNLSFGNGDPNSASGFLIPSYYVFALNKIDAKTHFKIVRSANHETNALAVANKQVDVATNNSENLEKIAARHPEKFKEIRVIWTSPMIPLDPLVMRKDMPNETKAKIRDFFLGYGKTEQSERDNLMKLSKLSGFRASSNQQLLPIRQIELFREKSRMEADTAMNASDRQVRIAEIDRKLVELNQQMAMK